MWEQKCPSCTGFKTATLMLVRPLFFSPGLVKIVTVWHRRSVRFPWQQTFLETTKITVTSGRSFGQFIIIDKRVIFLNEWMTHCLVMKENNLVLMLRLDSSRRSLVYILRTYPEEQFTLPSICYYPFVVTDFFR